MQLIGWPRAVLEGVSAVIERMSEPYVARRSPIHLELHNLEAVLASDYLQ